jgi:hypothetical protein
MHFSKPILLTMLAVALMAYAFDCGGVMTPEQAAQCCDSMACSSPSHQGQDCCKTMPAMHSPYMTSAVQGVSFSHAAIGAMVTISTSLDLNFVTRTIAAHSLAPPAFDPPALLSLRI